VSVAAVSPAVMVCPAAESAATGAVAKAWWAAVLALMRSATSHCGSGNAAFLAAAAAAKKQH
jgi:hypothetical protein